MSVNPYKPGGMRRFRLDESRSNGWFCTAQGVVFGDGTVALRTLAPSDARTIYYGNISELTALGATRIRWEDKCCFVCGVVCDHPEGTGWCLSCGASWAEPSDMPEPGKGSWVEALTLESSK